MQMGAMVLLSALLWTSVEIYQSLSKPSNVGVEADLLTPINIAIDEATLNKLVDRNEIAPIPLEPSPAPVDSGSPEL